MSVYPIILQKMEHIRKNIIKRIGAVKEKLVAIKSDPKKVCYGYAFGIFLAATPLIGLKVLIAILVTYLFKWNKVASIIGVFHINILNGPLFYGFSYLVGKFALGHETSYALPEKFTISACLDLFTGNYILLLDLFAGGLILGLPMAFAAYFFSYRLIRRRQRKAAVIFSHR